MDLEYLLGECEKKYEDPSETSYIDNIIKGVEDEFKGYKSIKTIRENEKKELMSSLAKCQREMKKLTVKSNLKVKNFDKRTRILKNINDKKKKIQNKINTIKIKLEDLEIESSDFDSTMVESVNTEVMTSSSSLTPYDDMLF